ncbi:MAG: hypothetical protein RBT58_00015 [Pseudomonadaceae bacterium]|nr:hypothetical protein [Pseudomonadaceae bacterium]NLC00807.1 hypothetical protein [Halopseudomonas formosensis]
MSADDPARWYCCSLGDGLQAAQPLDAIRQAFVRRYPVVTPDTAVFLRHRLEGLHCDTTVFFTPALADLAREFGAHRCYPPDAGEVELLIGSDQLLPRH